MELKGNFYDEVYVAGQPVLLILNGIESFLFLYNMRDKIFTVNPQWN